MARTIPITVDADKAGRAAYETFVGHLASHSPAKDFAKLSPQSQAKWRAVADAVVASIDSVGADD